jgi:hypothetical protein
VGKLEAIELRLLLELFRMWQRCQQSMLLAVTKRYEP